MEGIESPRTIRVPRIEEAGTPEFRTLIRAAMEAPAAEDLKCLWPEEIERVYEEASGLADMHNVVSIDPLVKRIGRMSNDQLAHDIAFAATGGVTKSEAVYVLTLLQVLMERLEIANKQSTRH